MTVDLPPDVRAEASKHARMAYAIASNHCHDDPFLHIVDAVTAVVAPEIERPLQARIEELEDRVMTLEAQRAGLLERCRQADRSKSLPDLSTGEIRRALGIPLLGGPDA